MIMKRKEFDEDLIFEFQEILYILEKKHIRTLRAIIHNLSKNSDDNEFYDKLIAAINNYCNHYPENQEFFDDVVKRKILRGEL